jgi:hypothetical protein
MEISRVPSGLPPSARDEVAQRARSGRGGEVGGDPTSAERRAATAQAAAERAAARTQTAEAVGRAERPDLAEPTRDPTAQLPPPARGARLDLRV